MSSKYHSPCVCASERRLPPTMIELAPVDNDLVLDPANSVPSRRARTMHAPAPRVIQDDDRVLSGWKCLRAEIHPIVKRPGAASRHILIGQPLGRGGDQRGNLHAVSAAPFDGTGDRRPGGAARRPLNARPWIIEFSAQVC